MRLKKLEINGFKSFLNKTILKIEDGVTAIVGPNGCGKSNVVDAIKWVFGEQSAKSLRSSEMQDVIFNGTETRDAVNMAEVSITLSNDDRTLSVDYDEVTVTRRVFRSGESEYLLNKTAVRLMDIRNLFFGTGVGTSSYSVIEQGKMDLVLSSKPEERRYIFEEASGITAYKSRKKEALSKLERAQENLIRLDDIIREVERQLKAIERQARKAERYKALYEELKNSEIKLARHKYDELKTIIDLTAGEIEKINTYAGELKFDIENSSCSLSGSKEEFNTVVNDLQIQENQIMRIKGEIDKNNYTIKMNDERVQELNNSEARLAAEINFARNSRNEIVGRVNDLENNIARVSEFIGEKENIYRELDENLVNITNEIEKQRREMDILRDKVTTLAEEKTRARNTVIRAEADIENSTLRIRRLENEKNSMNAERETLFANVKNIESEMEFIKRSLEEDKNIFESFTKEYNIKNSARAEKFDLKINLEKQLNELRPKISFLEKIMTEREGIKKSVKSLIQLSSGENPKFAGVYGIFSEILSVTSAFADGFEAIMGDLSQAILVKTRDTAEAMATYLKENAFGSVSFLIVDELAVIAGDGAVFLADNKDGMGVSDIAGVTNISLLEEHLRNALKTISRDIVFADNHESARLILSGENFKGKVICGNGEVLWRGAYRTGDYTGKDNLSIFGRKEKFDVFKKEEAALSVKLDICEKELLVLNSWIEGSRVKLSEMSDTLRKREKEYVDASNRLLLANERHQAVSKNILVVVSDIQEENNIINKLKKDIELLRQK
ncbi:chromosome partitioning protein Smc [Candidatus Omnitrophus magneticus]|uniref:Chromosome partitioning protein Smc n=1 Tax=Candidatus Omnitrophus magneticus TaxID=1609969 RepID=A0A0F0CRA5_9BACT|nr:chromosome partitioning protein Smc [Candidatus Omnitrophus magneticus]